jgi:serine/threonine protein kinase
MFLNHPNIIKMYGCFHDATNIYIILEVGTGGQLYHQLKKSQPLSEARIAFIMRQVCEAVNEIHSLRIIHRDIKPENIVLHDVPPPPCRTSSSCAISDGRCTRTINCGLLSAALPSTFAPKS